MMDDEWYSTVLYADTPIRNLSDIIRAQIWHYFNWGGRSMAHALLQLILLAGEHWADILNTGMTLLLGWLACMTADNNRSDHQLSKSTVLPLTLMPQANRKPVYMSLLVPIMYLMSHLRL